MDEKKGLRVKDMLLIGWKLLLVCAVVSAVVSGVNFLTADAYADNLRRQKEKAIGEIFAGEEISYRELTVEGAEGVLYEILAGEARIGYCAEVASPGFGGDISLMVGFHVDGSVRDVGIVSMSETPGLGSKVDSESFLSQFVGRKEKLEVKVNVDAITGATISSRAVTDGVNAAMALLNAYEAGGAANE